MNRRGDIFKGIEFSKSYSDRNGKLLQVFLTQDDKYRIYRPIQDFPPQFIEALLLQEDKFFYSHHGVNIASVFRAGWETYIKKSRRIGASTITMQVAKLKYNLYTKNIPGKLKQIRKAIYLEMCFSKDQILEAYVNLAPCGGNIEGFETAAWYYFNKDIRNLNLSDNIMLCVLPQNPIKRAPTPKRTPSELIQARKVLFASWLEKHPEDADKEVFMDMQMSTYCKFPNEARHFTEMLNIYKDQQFEKSKKTLKTSLDLDVQHKCEEIFKKYINQNKHFGVKNGAVLLLDWKTMEVIANIGSADYYNNEIEGQVNLTTSKRSPGSTLKPFIYALALDQGIIHYSSMLKDTPQTFNEYTPDNYGSIFKGPVHAWFALADSRNIPAITLNRDIKKYDLYDFMQDSGVGGMKEKDYYGLSIVLGTCEVTMLELVKMYGTLANKGFQYDINFTPQIRRGEGKKLLSEESSFIVRKMLEANTPPYQTKPQEIKDIPVAYKTGTSIGFKDCWSVGIFDRYICAVWIGNFSGEGNNSFIGRQMAAPLLFNLAYSILSDIPEKERLKREMHPPKCKQVLVCSVSGGLPNEDCPCTEWAWFIPGVSPIDKCKIHRKINVDTRTGYRTDMTPEEAPYVKSMVREFWPSDLQQLFEQAGLPRMQPPDYPPQEFRMDFRKLGYPPEILSPMSGTDYIFRLKDRSKNKIMLCATGDADTSELMWFEGANFIGRTKPGESMEWEPQPGNYEIVVTDQKGRSDNVWVSIKGTSE
ncbi:MAG: penicillin-binding protein 1C [Treponema sp.]|nr:penicillin-binding protein 1C [Treponema sp.]